MPTTSRFHERRSTCESVPSSHPGTEQPTEKYHATASTDVEGQDVSRPEADVFGDEAGADIHYKTCDWWHVGVLMLAENVSLGVLALSQALAVLGIVPGLLLIVFLGLTATYTGWIIGEFKLAHPSVQSYADAGEIVFGPVGREVSAFLQVLVLVFISGAHILTFAVAMNAMTDHATCTLIYSFVGLVICFVLGLPRTFKNVSYPSIFSCLSIVISVLIVMIAVGIQKPDMGNILVVRPGVPVVKGLTPVMNIVLAYAGHAGFFPFAAEMKDPRDYKKALFFQQGFAVTFYTLISAVIYYYAGSLVSSPALGSASPLVRKIAFGIALPTIIVAGVVNGSVACKYIYCRIWKGTNVIHENSWKSLGSWWAICVVLWLSCWVLAEAIPNFNLLLGLTAALCGSWLSYAIPPYLSMYLQRKRLFASKKMIAWTVFNCFVMVLGVAIFMLGMWASGWELSQGSGGKVFSCENNWNPVSWVADTS